MNSGDLHVWQADLRAPDSAARIHAACLSASERERARRFATEPDARRYVTGRAILRQILGRCLDADPGELRFEYAEQGKPRLVGQPAAPAFNLSHCGDVLLVAVAGASGVGVDIERLRPIAHAGRIVRRLFDPAAASEWLEASAAAREDIFFKHWTRIEALGKLHGGGVWHAARAAGHSVRDLEAPPGYRAAVAAAGPIDGIRRFTWAAAA